MMKKLKIWQDTIMLFIFFLMSLITIKYSMKNINEYLIPFFKISFFLFFYQLGYFYKTKLEGKYKINNCIYFLILIGIQLILLKISPNIGYDSFRMKFNTKVAIIPILASITGILFWTRIADIVQPIFKDSKIINFIGNNTSDIMYHHIFWIFILNTILYILSKIFKIATFDINMYKTDIYYFYTCGVPQAKIIYTIIGISGPLIIRYIYEKNKLRIEKKLKNKKSERKIKMLETNEKPEEKMTV